MKEQWTELSVIVSQAVADLVSDKLIEYGSQGTVFEDVPESIGLCKIIAYYPESNDIDDICRQLKHYLEALQEIGERVDASEIHVAVMTNPDWNSSWKEFFKPSRVGERMVIKPSWEIFDAQPSDVVIELDPGMAFGTGLHASTRLAITLLEQYMRADSNVLDVGVGSGILSLVAARLGAKYVLGVDIDKDAIEIAHENVRKNCRICASSSDMERCIELEVGSIDSLDISRQFDCILMNVRPNIIVPLLPYVATFLQTGGALIVSGILEEEGPELLHEIRVFNFISHQQVTEDGWVAYVLSQV
ncbi:MAG: 50S ribosomal protein L11 methyltransferase [bacterium]|nr:50S ribosomal protein L11 methyltransferase [bacterium]